MLLHNQRRLSRGSITVTSDMDKIPLSNSEVFKLWQYNHYIWCLVKIPLTQKYFTYNHNIRCGENATTNSEMYPNLRYVALSSFLQCNLICLIYWQS